MWNILSFLQSFIWEKRTRILMLGLDGAGKTTILSKLSLSKIVTTTYMIGFPVEAGKCKDIDFIVWDFGGCRRIRQWWKPFFPNTQGLIFVVDSSDRESLDIATEVLTELLEDDELRDAVVVVFANKQDLPNAMSVAEITDMLGLHSLRQRTWYIQGTCATNGSGLYEGLDWLSTQLKKK